MLLFHFTNTPLRHFFIYIYRKGRFARNKFCRLNVYPTKRIAWRKPDYRTLVYTDYSIGPVYTNDDIE